MTDNFKKILQKTILVEGVYSNNRLDRGGETVFGIARTRNPNWEGWAHVDKITAIMGKASPEMAIKNSKPITDLVAQFYWEHYWLPLKCDEFEYLIAAELFDTAVNQGVSSAGKYLQRSLNRLNRNQKDYADLLEDGEVGNMTIGAYKAYMNTASKNGRTLNSNRKVLLKAMNYFQLRRYDDIIAGDPTQEEFMYGWIINRIQDEA